MNNYYNNIIENILSKTNTNDNILLFLHNYYNPLDNFNHLIKIKNLNIYLIIDNKDINLYDKLNNNIKGEENEDKIHVIMNSKNNLKKIDAKIHYIILFHLYSIDYLVNILINIRKLNNINETHIYIYTSLSNDDESIIYYKNIIRGYIRQFTDNNIGNVLSLSNIISKIKYMKYHLENIHICKKSSYIIYGDNSLYELLLYKN